MKNYAIYLKKIRVGYLKAKNLTNANKKAFKKWSTLVKITPKDIKVVYVKEITSPLIRFN